MSSSIDELQKRIAEIQAISTGLNKQTTITPPSDSIRDIIREEIRLAMDLLKDSTLVKPEIPLTPTKELTLLDVVGRELTEKEQLWLSKPEILADAGKKLIIYLQSENGNRFLKDFLTYFKGLYED